MGSGGDGHDRRSVSPSRLGRVSEHPGTYAATGLFICFEGGEGAGKSTQAKILTSRLEGEGHRVVLTHEPGDTEVGAAVRRIVLDPATGELADRTEALLYAADKAEHVDAVVLPALARGDVVVTDRYVDSTLAYQGAGRSLDAGDLAWVARWATGDLRPHLTVLLDLEPGEGLTRFEERDRIEGESLDFHRRVRAAFLQLAHADPDHYLVLDARAPVDEISDAVHTRVMKLAGTLRDGRGAPSSGTGAAGGGAPSSGTGAAGGGVPSSGAGADGARA
jgi:dTMP kinase